MGTTTMAINDMTPGISGGNPPLSPLPGAATLDEAIERMADEYLAQHLASLARAGAT
jgi:hypothetical protein